MSDEHSGSDVLRYDGGSTAPKRRGRKKKRHTVATVITATVVALSLVTGLGMVFFYRHLNDNLDVVSVERQLHDRPAKQAAADEPQEPINILVMGSDTRDGAGNDIDGLTGGGQRSDTTIMFHLSADRTFAYGISIPRDSLVDRPDCLDGKGNVIPGADDVMWNEAFSLGGPACTMQQFEQLTDIRLDNYVVLDFNGFQDMVDAVDGVEVCIPEAIEDNAHGINIPAGTREISGKEALNYVRARYTLGDGSDLGRIKRQQAFIAAMAGKVVSAGTLTRVDRVVGFLNAATSSLTTDFTSITQIGKVGNGFKSIGLDKIKFITVPWQYSPADPNRVEWLPEADRLWQRVIDDVPLTRGLQDGVIKASDDVDGSSGSGSGRGQWWGQWWGRWQRLHRLEVGHRAGCGRSLCLTGDRAGRAGPAGRGRAGQRLGAPAPARRGVRRRASRHHQRRARGLRRASVVASRRLRLGSLAESTGAASSRMRRHLEPGSSRGRYWPSVAVGRWPWATASRSRISWSSLTSSGVPGAALGKNFSLALT